MQYAICNILQKPIFGKSKFLPKANFWQKPMTMTMQMAMTVTMTMTMTMAMKKTVTRVEHNRISASFM
jgi:hypothetical protein